MSKETITKEIEIYHCDICGNESKNIIQCPICKKDVCQYCRAWNQCIKCWNKNNTFATIESKTVVDEGYEGRSHTSYKLKFDSPNKWNDLLKRFNGKHVKIIFEEVKDDEIINVDDITVDDININHECDRCGRTFDSNELTLYDNEILCDDCIEEIENEEGSPHGD